jgi:hypothetical protein
MSMSCQSAPDPLIVTDTLRWRTLGAAARASWP